MTRTQALNKAVKRWGTKAMVRAGTQVTSQEKRDRARVACAELKAKRQALEQERADKLKELPWLQEMNKAIQKLRDAENQMSGQAWHYKFAVGYVDDILGAFHVQGQGDTWEQAFEKAEKIR
jgi:hypothetical protein